MYYHIPPRWLLFYLFINLPILETVSSNIIFRVPHHNGYMLLIIILLISTLYNCWGYFPFHPFPRLAGQSIISRRHIGCSTTSEPPCLLKDPLPNSIGNFFENKTDEMSFIQCYMLAVGKIDGIQYGVGFPVDMPVMLSYFEGNELKPVRPDYPDYDHLVNHVSTQMDSNDFQLYKTPIVLTLQGEFEDESINDILPGGSLDDEIDDENYDEDALIDGGDISHLSL